MAKEVEEKAVEKAIDMVRGPALDLTRFVEVREMMDGDSTPSVMKKTCHMMMAESPDGSFDSVEDCERYIQEAYAFREALVEFCKTYQAEHDIKGYSFMVGLSNGIKLVMYMARTTMGRKTLADCIQQASQDIARVSGHELLIESLTDDDGDGFLSRLFKDAFSKPGKPKSPKH